MLTRRPRRVAATVLTEVVVVAALTGDLAELALASRGRTEVVQTTDDAEHGGQSKESGLLAQSSVGSKTELDVGLQGSVEAHLVGVEEDLGVAVGLDL